MTLYIAICDNNIADRKQTERLLEREKDKRLREHNDVLYIDSFGSEEALMTTPIRYDIFFVDITEGDSNGMEIARKLRRRGITAPIVLCESTINYTSYVNAPEDLIYIEKPINAGQISHLVDVAIDRASHRTPLVEIKCQKETRFIRYDELIRAIPVDRFYTRLCLTGGEFVDMSDSMSSLEKQCSTYGCFIKCKKDLVNIYHIEDATEGGFKLTNGDIVNYSFTQKDEIIRTMARNLRFLQVH